MRVFCYLCATRLEPKSKSSWSCPSCQYIQYENPRPGVELILSHDNKILISERGREPSKGAYDVPGGFVELNEANEQAVLREIEEELLLSSQDYSTPEYLGSYYSEYKYEKETYHILVTVFTAQLLVDPKRISPQDDVASVKWVGEDELAVVPWSSKIHFANALHVLQKIAISA